MKKLLFLLPLAGLMIISCGKDDDQPNPTTPPQSLPSAIAGTSLNMEFTAPQTGAPYTLGQIVQFTFSSSGSLGIDVDPTAGNGDEITISSFTESSGEYIWEDAAAGVSYHLSLKSDNSVNEINVFDAGGTNFLGQFIPESGGGNLVVNYEGSYTVTSVDKGTHTRMTVSIDASGNIDFDTGIMLNAADFALVSDRLDCCDGIWIDMNPYPTEPYERVNLHMDPNSGDLIRIEYYPQYPSVSGRVEVTLTKGTSGGGSNELNVTGDFAKVGGAVFTPAKGQPCTSCTISEKFTWTQLESSAPDRVFSIEIFNSNGMVLLDFSAGSAFTANASDLASLGIVRDATAKTFTFTNVDMNEKFSQPGMITLNGTLTYE